MLPPVQPGSRDRVQVDVGVASRAPAPTLPVPLALIALVPQGWGLVSDERPSALVRKTKLGRSAVVVEQLRFSSQNELRCLPGLDGSAPSRLRDSAVLAMDSGAPFLDVVLIHETGLKPWELDREALTPVLAPFLEHLFGTILLYPDMLGPCAIGPTPPEEPEDAWLRLRRFVRIHGRGWSERYQVVLLDCPPEPGRFGAEHLSRAQGVDAAICCWLGDDDQLRRHGWRSASAAVVGLMLSFGDEIYRGPSGNRVPLGAGRRARPARRLDPTAAARRVPADLLEHSLVGLQIQPDGVSARVVSEPSLRRPRGVWSLAALRTAKIIHRKVVQAAEQVVFRPANEAHAFALVAAIDDAIRPFVTHGILLGPNGSGAPELESDVVANPTAPGLVATITGQLKPWCTTVKLNVEVRDGGRVGMEVTS